MLEALLILCGMGLAGLVSWSWASARVRARLAAGAVELEGRARAAESIRDELRRRLEQSENEISQLRSALESERQKRTEAETRLQAAQQNIQEQKKLLEEAQARLTDVFRGISAEALQSNNQAFLQLAGQKLEAVVAEAKGDIGKRQQAVDELIKPLREALERYEGQIKAMEENRQKVFGGLEKQIESLGSTQQMLQQETAKLVTALRNPQIRGRWGEVTLHRVVELAGMSEHCDYSEQMSSGSEDGRVRPDLIVHLPAERQIVVDSKVPLDAYLKAVSACGEEERNESLRQHARQVKEHMKKLAGKSYWEQFEKAPEFVVMFLPGESFFAAAVECEPSLIEEGMEKHVVIATPTTLIALLRAVAFGWRQEQIAKNARQISELGKELHERMRTLTDHFCNLGASLAKTVEHFNKAVGSLESRVLPAARRFRELGAATGDEIPVLDGVDKTPRNLDSADD